MCLGRGHLGKNPELRAWDGDIRAFDCRDIRKASLTRGLGLSLETGEGLPTYSPGGSAHSQPTQGEASQFDSGEPGKQMVSCREGFCCKSLINEEKFKEIRVAAGCTHPSSPPTSPCRSFLSFDFGFPFYFLPSISINSSSFLSLSSLPSSLLFPGTFWGLSAHPSFSCPLSALLPTYLPPPFCRSSLSSRGCFHCLLIYEQTKQPFESPKGDIPASIHSL